MCLWLGRSLFLLRLSAGGSLTRLLCSAPSPALPQLGLLRPAAGQGMRQTDPSQASWTWLLGWLRWGRGAVTAVLLWCGIPGQPRRAGVPVLARLPQFPGCASDLSWILGSRPVLPLLFIHPCSVFIVLNAPVGHQHLYTRDVPLSHGQAGRRGISDLKRKAQTTVKCDS